MGRWSRILAEHFVSWLAPEVGRWLDVGCGTGALSSTLLGYPDVQVVVSDQALPFVIDARARIGDGAVGYAAASATALPFDDRSFTGLVSGLVLNFVPDQQAGVAEMVRVVQPGGTVAAYVWDYAGRMAYLQTFWDAAADLDPDSATTQQEQRRFAASTEDFLPQLFRDAGLLGLEQSSIELEMAFQSFEEYWVPFLGGTGPAPAYLANLAPEKRDHLRDQLQQRLSPRGEPFSLDVRAWMARGERPM